MANISYGVDVYRLEDGILHLIVDLDMHEHSQMVKQIDFALAGAVIVAAGNRGSVRLWQVPEGTEINELFHTQSELYFLFKWS